MSHLLAQLRQRSRALATALLCVLMATWLSMLCPDCMVQAAEQPVAPPPCHSDSVPAPEPHGCCPALQAAPCSGGDCAQLAPVTISATDVVAPAAPQFESLPSTVIEQLAYHSPPTRLTQSAPLLAVVSCPLYLRHCSFLN